MITKKWKHDIHYQTQRGFHKPLRQSLKCQKKEKKLLFYIQQGFQKDIFTKNIMPFLSITDPVIRFKEVFWNFFLSSQVSPFWTLR